MAVAIADIRDHRRAEPFLIGLAGAGFAAYWALGWVGWHFAGWFEARLGPLAVLILYLVAMAALFLAATVVYLMLERRYLTGGLLRANPVRSRRPRPASWWPRASRFRAACSTWRVATRFWRETWSRLRIAWPIWAMPVACWPAEATICDGGLGGVAEGVGQGVDGLAGLAADPDRGGDPLGHLLGGQDRGVGRLLDLGEDLADPGGGLLGLVGQGLDLAGDDGEAPAVLAGPARPRWRR